MCVLALVTAGWFTTGAAAPAASSSVVVSLTAVSATNLNAGGCPTGAANQTSFGTVLPGTTAVTTIDCSVIYGSSNDSSMLRLWQRDRGGVAMLSRQGDAGLVADWPLEGDWADQSPTNAPLVPLNTPTFNPASGPYGGSGHFVTASTQSAASAYRPAYDLSPPFVVEARFRTTTVPASAAGIVGKTISASNRNFLIFVSGSGLLRGSVSAGGSNQQVGTRSVADGAWHHVAMVLSGTDPNAVQSLYVDGVLDQQQTLSAAVDRPAASVVVGFAPSALTFNGDIDEVRLSAGVTPTPADVKAWATGTIADYGGGVNFASSSAFGACLRTAPGSGTDGSTWTADADADCADGDADTWHPIPALSSDPAAKVVHALTPTTTAQANLRFGVKTASTQPPGLYSAPMTFEVLAPSA